MGLAENAVKPFDIEKVLASGCNGLLGGCVTISKEEIFEEWLMVGVGRLQSQSNQVFIFMVNHEALEV